MSIERCYKQSESQKVIGIEAGYSRVLIDIDELSSRLCIPKGTLYREVCPATENRELALLKHMFNMAERWGFHRGSTLCGG